MTVVVVAPTRLEARAARRALRHRGVEVVRCGLRARRVAPSGPLLLVGLCGALTPLAPGTVVVPDEIAADGGSVVTCDRALAAALRTAAQRLGWPVAGGRQLTAAGIVRGPERTGWAAAGFETVEMEAAHLLTGRVGATIRVVLDAPGQELSASWAGGLASLTALAPWHWVELLRLLRTAPGYARRAGEVAACALDDLGVAGAVDAQR